uniref:Kelch-like protein 9 n=1 Tax=Gouania willdenowi TaxID=441366 RepID=A0A8C5DD78_GOUWI
MENNQEEDDNVKGGEEGEDVEVEKVFESNCYSVEVFSAFNEFRKSSLLTDLTLSTADGKSFNVHTIVLAAVSFDYFRSMFTLGMKEANQRRVSLPYVLSSELQILISCSYSGSLPLCWGSVYELTGTALQLQYQPALALCLDFLLQELNPHNCLDVRSFAEAFEVPQLLQGADDFVLRQFQKVACTPKFKDLPARQLMNYLRSHALCVSSEIVVFQAVVTWIQARPTARLRLAKALMKTIHFPLMTFKEFKEVQNHNIWSKHSLMPLFQSIFEDFCSDETRTQNQCRIYLPKESLVLIGGDHITDDLSGRSISKDLWFGHSLRSHTGFKKAMEWRRLDEMPDASFSHEVAILNRKLYVFDPHLSSWERLADMLERRSFFSVVVLNDKIYAIGGSGDPDYNDTVERYCPSTNSWSFTLPLDLPLGGHVAKVLQGHVFVSGGQNTDYLSLSSLFLYHPETGSTYLANMARPRAHHCMEVLGERLYVAGGVTTVGESAVVDLLECEVYNPMTDTWTWFMPLPVPRVGAGSVVMEEKFYVLGGYSQEDYSDTKTIHRYDCVTQRWENVGRMPGPNNDIRACLLKLPKHLRS